jgi:hypothetical protein
MPETYGHTLIPGSIDFVPQPHQVAAFLDNLAKLDAAPLRAALRIGKPGFRSGVNPATGETLTIPVHRYTTLEAAADVSAALSGLDDYNVELLGEGPPRLPPFALWLHDIRPLTGGQPPESHANDCAVIEFDSKKSYGFIVQCCLRADVVATSDRHGVMPPERQMPTLGRPDKFHTRLGVFHHPCTNKILEVPNAGCARFWVQFEFGKWLFPKIEDSLNLLEPSVVELAKTSFGTDFVQGCYWYE